MKLKTLYAKSSNGKIKQWSIETKGNTMIESWGYIDGKIQSQSRTVEGKNIGRSNETSPDKQAELEATAKWKKKIDEQYNEDKNNLLSYSDQEVLLPMLALKYTERKHDIKFPCYVQPKLNGCRCLYQNGKFMSRGGKEFNTLSHLIPDLKKLGVAVPDGEIYVHGMSFQDIIRLVKKDRGIDNSKLEYWIYDQVNKETFEDRCTMLLNKFEQEYNPFKDYKKLKFVPTFKVNSEAEVKKYHDKFVQEGYEGVIVRNAAGLYKVKHRSADLLKYKEFIDEEFIITGAHEGTGPDAGTVIFEVKTKDNKPFSVRPKGTREQRTEWLKDIKNICGKMLTVRYQNLSEAGVPIFPVGVIIRDFE